MVRGMKPILGWILGAVTLSPLLTWGLPCSENEYPLQEWKCCKYCPPGEQLATRCKDTSETICEPCEENYYNDAYTYSRCKPCTACHSERGLQEVRACRGTSNAVCACLPGHAPEDSKVEKRCKACARGYFSRGGNEKCRPWTNCTASGRKALHPGKQDADTICDEPSSEVPTLRAITQPIPFENGGSMMTVMPRTPQPVLAQNQGFVWILAILVFLTAAGIFLLWFFYQRTKKKEVQLRCKGIFAVPCKDEGSSYRMPVQEEQLSGKFNSVQV